MDQNHWESPKVATRNTYIGSYKPDSTMFRLKNTGTMGSNQLPESNILQYRSPLI